MNIIITKFLESESLVFFMALLFIFILYSLIRSKWLAIATITISKIVISFLYAAGVIDLKTFIFSLTIMAIILIAIILSLFNQRSNPFNN